MQIIPDSVYNYYKPRLGNHPFAVIIYLSLGVALFAAVIGLSFTEASNFKNNKNTSTPFLVDDPKVAYNALGYLTLITGALTILDFFLTFNNIIKAIRLTPFTIATGVLATFIGLSMWILTPEKSLNKNPAIIVVLQTCANAIQLAAIFNHPDDLMTATPLTSRFL